MSNQKPLSKYPVIEKYIAHLLLSHVMLPYSSLLSDELSNQIQEFKENFKSFKLFETKEDLELYKNNIDSFLNTKI